FSQFEKLREKVSQELEQVVTVLPRDELQSWNKQFMDAAALAEETDDGKTRAAIAALEKLKAALLAQTPQLAGPRAEALLRRLDKTLKGTDGGLLDAAVREGFLKRFRALETGTALPAEQRFKDATALDDEVTKAVAKRVAAVRQLLADVAA